MSSWSELGVCGPSPAASTTLWLSHRLARQFAAFSPLEGLPPRRSERPGVQCRDPQLSPGGLSASFLGSEVVFQPWTLRRLHRRQCTWSWGDTCSPSSAWQPTRCRDLDSACGEARTHAVPKEMVSGLGRSLPGCWVPVMVSSPRTGTQAAWGARRAVRPPVAPSVTQGSGPGPAFRESRHIASRSWFHRESFNPAADVYSVLDLHTTPGPVQCQPLPTAQLTRSPCVSGLSAGLRRVRVACDGLHGVPLQLLTLSAQLFSRILR